MHSNLHKNGFVFVETLPKCDSSVEKKKSDAFVLAGDPIGQSSDEMFIRPFVGCGFALSETLFQF